VTCRYGSRPGCLLLLAALLPGLPQRSGAADAIDPDAIRVLLSPVLETTLVAPMQGILAELTPSLGVAVTAGQVLVTLDCAEPDARLQIAQAEVDSSRQVLAVKTRLRELTAAGDMEVVLAQVEVKRSAAGLALATAQRNKCLVLSPFAGRVVRIHVKPFQGVEIGTPLLELVSDDPPKLRLNVPSRLLSRLQLGTPFVVDIDETGRSYQARVTAINARVDPVAQTLELEAALLQAHPELLAGMSGVARFQLDAAAP